ncbi:hypothetical protein ACQCT6_05005 [Cytobacillus gottheilii]|uniref:UPF0738 protein J1899_07620 n=1 Tax=Cytobacillus gottheilii TaxID=859144 RepID=A0ABX8FFU7_9BACI|nr:hypothetical protein [Cytobacillus gottheilii]QVY62903.1 hypothetical protein J1899_07620 [Cytobacillus gottheilii]
MKNKLTISAVHYQEEVNELVLSIDREIDLSNIKPMEQMLVDSDHLAFVYILEVDNDYTYLVLPEHSWSDLKKAHQTEAAVKLTNGKTEILLTAFQEELSYLIENITGNSNYGEVMVEKVESIFQGITQE